MFRRLPIVFDSSALTERDKFAYAREEYGRKALKVDLDVPKGGPFHLRMRAEHFGNVRVAVIESTPYRVARTPKLIDDGDDRIGLVFSLTGTFCGEQAGSNIAVRPGEATPMLADRTGWFGTKTGGRFLTIRIPPSLVRAFARDTNRIKTGISVRPNRLSLTLIQNYVSTIGPAGAEAASDLRDLAGRHLAELATHAFCGQDDGPQSLPEGDGLRAGRVAATLAHIREHFTDPGYDVNACAQHLGISARHLQKTLEIWGTNFSSELRKQRLQHARHLLADALSSGRRIADIALDSGYSDISHFNRQFRAHFGETPTALRGEKNTP